MRALSSSLVLPALATLAALTGCDNPQASSVPDDPRPDRHHARSFDWSRPLPEPLARASARAPDPRVTRFETREALGEALRSLRESLERPGASDSLWKPLDHSCPEADLALWNRHGEVRLGDSLVLDEAVLRARCMPLRDTGALARGAAYSTGEALHRVHPYKMIGRAWSDVNLFIARSAGAETQFKKERDYFGLRGWWDTDASRIGVRVYLLDCGGAPAVCYFGGEKSNWHRNSASVLQNDFAGVFESRAQTANLPAGLKRLDLKVSSAVIALHSADHAGIRFRARSTAALASATPVLSMPATDYVTW